MSYNPYNCRIIYKIFLHFGISNNIILKWYYNGLQITYDNEICLSPLKSHHCIISLQNILPAKYQFMCFIWRIDIGWLTKIKVRYKDSLYWWLFCHWQWLIGRYRFRNINRAELEIRKLFFSHISEDAFLAYINGQRCIRFIEFNWCQAKPIEWQLNCFVSIRK